MIFQLDSQHPLRKGLLQLTNQTVLGKQIPQITPSQQLIQSILANRHIDDPFYPTHMTPHTKFPTVPTLPSTPGNGLCRHLPIFGAHPCPQAQSDERSIRRNLPQNLASLFKTSLPHTGCGPPAGMRLSQRI